MRDEFVGGLGDHKVPGAFLFSLARLRDSSSLLGP